RARLGEHLPTLDLLALGTAEERAGVVPGLGEVEGLVEHLETRDDGLLDLGARLDLACSIRPVTTVPRPVIVKTSSIGIRNGLSVSRVGSGMYSSTACMRSRIFCACSSSPSSAFRAEPVTIGMSSPGNS